MLSLSSRVAIMKYHRLGNLNHRDVSSPSSGGWKSKLEVLAGWFLLEVPRENLFQAFLLAPAGCRQSLVFLGL